MSVTSTWPHSLHAPYLKTMSWALRRAGSTNTDGQSEYRLSVAKPRQTLSAIRTCSRRIGFSWLNGEHGHAPSCSVRDYKSLDQLRDHQFLKKECNARGQFHINLNWRVPAQGWCEQRSQRWEPVPWKRHKDETRSVPEKQSSFPRNTMTMAGCCPEHTKRVKVTSLQNVTHNNNISFYVSELAE